jgi:REP element-mobilizing transposase RayT
MRNNLEELNPGGFYHVFSRANGNEKLFLSEENYQFFLRKYQQYIHPLVNTYCYCLMPNHFHFLIQIKDEKDIKAAFAGTSNSKDYQNSEKLISKQFSNFLSSYSQAFNKQQNRRGSLFMRPFKRTKITDDKYKLNVVRYIHQNPVEAGFCRKPEEWQYSSYKDLIEGKVTFLKHEELISWFDDVRNFKYMHGLPEESGKI